MNRIFLLSPARCTGKRAGYLLREGADFELAMRLRAGQATLGEVFTFMSGLYFRGKVAYAKAFGRCETGHSAALVIVPGKGLVPLDEVMSRRRLAGLANVPVDPKDARYRRPLVRDARAVAGRLSSECQIVLLGSIATRKYVDLLVTPCGGRLHYPAEFKGIGDMSRGAIMLRRASSGEELTYVRAQCRSV